MASQLLSELPYGSYLVYSPRGTSEISRKSRQIRDAVKGGHIPTLRYIVSHLQENFHASGLDAVLGADVTLVPCPRSSPLVEGALWPGRLIAEELVRAGLGRQVLILLERVETVPKSAFQARGERPNAQRHFDTIRASSDLEATSRITVVDDFLTKGNTVLGAASRLAEVYPRANLAVFAPVRTKGLQPEVEALVAPWVGRVRLGANGEAGRDD